MLRKDIMVEGLGGLRYEESAWSGKKRIYINGIEAKKVKRNRFIYEGVSLAIAAAAIAVNILLATLTVSVLR